MATFKPVDTIIDELLAKHNGSTVAVNVGVPSPTTGYVSALAGYEMTFSLAVASSPASGRLLDRWVSENRNRAGLPGHYLGMWYNEDNRTLYFDVVKAFPEKEQAIEFGKANKQIAIYSIPELKEIRL